MSPPENNTVINSEGREIISSVTEESGDESQLSNTSLNSSTACQCWCKRKEYKQR
jgi:hypothetical protein